MAQGRGGATRDTTRPVRASGEGGQTEPRSEGRPAAVASGSWSSATWTW